MGSFGTMARLPCRLRLKQTLNYMQTTPENPISAFGRNLYNTLLPASMRQRLDNAPIVQGIRESFRDEEAEIPYILLEEQHIANLRVVLNRNALLQALPSNAVVAEIGVASGDFSKRILRYAKPSRLHLIDAWDDDRYHSGLELVVTNKMNGEIESGRVSIHRGYSTTILTTFPDHYFDWVYLDTDHTYETTRDELNLLSQKVKPGGIIAGHDYITGDWKMRNRYGVVEAVNEFCVENNWELVFTTYETHRHLSFGIREMGY